MCAFSSSGHAANLFVEELPWAKSGGRKNAGMEEASDGRRCREAPFQGHLSGEAGATENGKASPSPQQEPAPTPPPTPPLPGNRAPAAPAPSPRLRDMREPRRAPALCPSPPPLPSRLCHGDTEWPDPGSTPRDPRPGNRPGVSPPSLPGVPGLGRAPRSCLCRLGRHRAPCCGPALRMRGAGGAGRGRAGSCCPSGSGAPGPSFPLLRPSCPLPGSSLPLPGWFSLAPLSRRGLGSAGRSGSGREGGLSRQVPASWRSFRRWVPLGLCEVSALVFASSVSIFKCT